MSCSFSMPATAGNDQLLSHSLATIGTTLPSPRAPRRWRAASIGVLCCALVGVAPAMRAQAVGQPSEAPLARPVASTLRPPTHRDGDPLSTVGLSASQRKTIAALSTTFRTRQQAILGRQQANVPISAADQAALWQLGEAHNAAVRAELTPAQRATLDAWIKERHAARMAEMSDRFAAQQAARVQPTGAPVGERVVTSPALRAVQGAP